MGELPKSPPMVDDAMVMAERLLRDNYDAMFDVAMRHLERVHAQQSRIQTKSEAGICDAKSAWREWHGIRFRECQAPSRPQQSAEARDDQAEPGPGPQGPAK